ncbi:MAG: hypothetical protein JOY97_09225, partial [Hyphomicrobiales bacterium]|nr:hypothetical protein [Hyphomicrobiales bacterium]
MSFSFARKLGVVIGFLLAANSATGNAFAQQCTPATTTAMPLNNTTVICTGTVTNQNTPNGYGTGVETGLTINVQANATVTATANFGQGISVGNGNTINNRGTITGANLGILANDAATDTLTVNNNSTSSKIVGLAGVDVQSGGIALVNL